MKKWMVLFLSSGSISNYGGTACLKLFPWIPWNLKVSAASQMEQGHFEAATGALMDHEIMMIWWQFPWKMKGGS